MLKDLILPKELHELRATILRNIKNNRFYKYDLWMANELQRRWG